MHDAQKRDPQSHGVPFTQSKSPAIPWKSHNIME